MSLLANLAGGVLCWLFTLFSNNYVLAVIAFSVFMKIIMYPLNLINSKLSRKNQIIQRKVLLINQNALKDNISSSDTGKKIAELYKKEHFTYFDFLIGPVITIVSIFLLLGLIKAVFSPLTCVLKIPAQEILTLVNATTGGTESAVFSEFDTLKATFLTLVSPETVEKIQTLFDGMNLGSINLAVIPTINNLIVMPIVALLVFVVSNGIGFLFSYLLKRKRSMLSNVLLGLTVITYCLFVFRTPAILCVYWIASSVLSICTQIFNFLNAKYQLKSLVKQKYAKFVKKVAIS